MTILCLDLYPNFNWIVLVLLSSFLRSFYILNIRPLSDVELLKILFLFCRQPFCPMDGALCLTVGFQFHEAALTNC